MAQTPQARRDALLRALAYDPSGRKRPGAGLVRYDASEAVLLLQHPPGLLVLRTVDPDLASLRARLAQLRAGALRRGLSVCIVGGGAEITSWLRSQVRPWPLRDPLILYHVSDDGVLWCSRWMSRSPALAVALDRILKGDSREISEEERAALLLPSRSAAENEEGRFWESLSSRPTWATDALTGAIALLYLLEVFWGGSNATLYRMGANSRDAVLSGEVFRLFSSAFLHVNLLHLVVNAWALRAIGTFLERVIGTASFVVLYAVSALAGSLSSILFGGSHLSAGASGALWGLMVAQFSLSIRPQGLVPESLSRRIRSVGWPPLIANLLLSFTPGIDLFAHLGGGLAGGVLLLSGALRPGGRRTVGVAALAGVLALAMVLCVAAALISGRPWEPSASAVD